MKTLTRRTLAKSLAAAAAPLLRAQSSARQIARGPFQPSWDSLHQYRAPDWFRDAKFGIWAHWSAQCVPEQGDWYARNMYIQGTPQNLFHVANYGHPSKFGFKDIDHLWKAEHWQPEELMQLYVKAGAKYFVSLANHHDNFDNYDSKYHRWNSVNLGPKTDIIGRWAKIARANGLRFGVSNHSSHAWHWFQPAFGYDPEGPLAGVPYDGFKKKEAGRGQWWDGYDPQELYVGPSMPLPPGMTSMKEAEAWHKQHDGHWYEDPPPNNPQFTDNWFLRCQDLLDKYQPDLIYFDDQELPLGQAGLDIAAHYYNSNLKNHGGHLEAVLNSKGLQADHMGTMVLDIERGRADKILPYAWQTDTCIGDWHYRRSLYTEHKYKTARAVLQTLCDIVSKNGNLLLSIPVRGDGTIDEDEQKFLGEFAAWMPVHGEAIYGTRPYTVYGEGAPDVKGSGNFNEKNARAYTAEDIRFTTKGDVLYAFVLGWPAGDDVVIKSLTKQQRPIASAELLGNSGRLTHKQEADGLHVTLPERITRPPYPFALRLRSA